MPDLLSNAVSRVKSTTNEDTASSVDTLLSEKKALTEQKVFEKTQRIGGVSLPNSSQDGIGTLTDYADQVNGGNPDRILHREGNVVFTEGNGPQYVSPNGSMFPIKDEDHLQRMMQSEEDIKFSRDNDVAPGSMTDTIHGIGTVISDIASDTRKNMLLGSINFTESLDMRNRFLNSAGKTDQLTTEEDQKLFLNMQKKTIKGQPFTEAEKAFENDPRYAEMHKLYLEVEDNKLKSNIIDNAKDTFLDKYIPTSDIDDIYISKSMEKAEKENGIIGAVDVILRNPFYATKKAVESTPYMVAFTLGSPVTQAGVITNFVVAKEREITTQFMQDNGRDPNADERVHIKLGSALSVVAERYGDMKFLKGFNIGRYNKIAARAAETAPSTVAKYITKPAVGVALEGVSGSLTEIGEQYGLKGKIDDGAEILYAGVNEAVGAAGLGPTMKAGQIGAGVAAVTLGAAYNKVTSPTPSDVPTQTDTPETDATPQPSPRADDSSSVEQDSVAASVQKVDSLTAKNEAEQLPTKVVLNKEEEDALNQNAALVDSGEFNNIPVSELADTAATLLEWELTKELTPEQTTQLDKLTEAVQSRMPSEVDTSQDTDTSDKEVVTLQSLAKTPIPVNDSSSQEDIDLNKAATEYQYSGNRLRNLKKNGPKSSIEVHSDIIDGEGSWTGFDSYLAKVQEAITSSESGAESRGKANIYMQQMSSFLAGLTNKYEAFSEAASSVSNGGFTILHGDKSSGQMVYSEVATLPEDYLGQGNGNSINAVRKKYFAENDINPELGQAKFMTIVHNRQSKKLIKAMNEEIKHGQNTVRLINTFLKSSRSPVAADTQQNLIKILKAQKAISDKRKGIVEEVISTADTSETAPVTSPNPDGQSVTEPVEEVTDTTTTTAEPDATSSTAEETQDSSEPVTEEVDTDSSDIEETSTEPSPVSFYDQGSNDGRTISPTTPIGQLFNLSGSKFTDLTKIRTDGISGLDNKLFDTTSETYVPDLVEALTYLNISPEDATALAERFIQFKAQFNTSREQLKDEKSREFPQFMNSPLSMLQTITESKEGDLVTDLPDQVQFAAMIALGSWRNTTQSNKAFSSQKEISQFFTGDTRGTALTSDVNDASSMGPLYNDAVKQIGAAMSSILGFSAVTIHKPTKDSVTGETIPLTESQKLANDGAKEFNVRLSTNLGIMAIATASHTDNPKKVGFITLTKFFDFTPSIPYENIDKKVHELINNYNNLRNEYNNSIITPVPTTSLRNLEQATRKAATLLLQQLSEDTKNPYRTSIPTSVRHIIHSPVYEIDGIPLTISDPRILSRDVSEQSKENHKRAVRVDKALDIDLPPSQRILTEPSKSKLKFTSNDVMSTPPEQVERIVNRMKKVGYSTNKTFGILEGISNINLDLIHTIMGVTEVDASTEYASKVMSTEAANKEKMDDLHNLMEASLDGTLDNPIYFEFALMKNLRLLMQGKLNPQNSKLIRYVLSASEPTTYNEDTIVLFKAAVLQHFNQKEDKMIGSELSPAFDALIERKFGSPEFGEFTLMDLAEKADKGDYKYLSEAIPFIMTPLDGSKGVVDNLGVLQGIQGLVDYLPVHKGDSKLVESDISIEIDGITNGLAISLNQFPSFLDDNGNMDIAALEEQYNMTGTYFGKTQEQLEHLVSGIYAQDNSRNDAYVKTGLAVLNNSSAEDMLRSNDLDTKVNMAAIKPMYEAAFTQVAVSLESPTVKDSLDKAGISLKEVHKSTNDLMRLVDVIADESLAKKDKLKAFRDLNNKAKKIAPFLKKHGAETKDHVAISSLLEGIHQRSRTYFTNSTSQKNTGSPERINVYKEVQKGLDNIFQLDSHNIRDFIKYPLMIFLYNGGIKSISEGIVSSTILKDNVYPKLGELQRGYNAARKKSFKEASDYIQEVVVPYQESLERTTLIYDTKSGDSSYTKIDLVSAIQRKNGIAGIPDKGVAPFVLPEQDIIRALGIHLQPRLKLAFKDVYGDVWKVRQTVTDAIIKINSKFLDDLKEEKLSYIQEVESNNTSGKTLLNLDNFPKVVERRLIKERLLELFPAFKGPFMDSDNVNEFIDLTLQKPASTASEISYKTSTLSNSNNKVKKHTSAQSRKEYVLPSVAPLVALIQSFDAANLYAVLDKHPKLVPLYDAVIGNPEDVYNANIIYGDAYLQMGTEYSIAETILEQAMEIDVSNPNLDYIYALSLTQQGRNALQKHKEEQGVQSNQLYLSASTSVASPDRWISTQEARIQALKDNKLKEAILSKLTNESTKKFFENMTKTDAGTRKAFDILSEYSDQHISNYLNIIGNRSTYLDKLYKDISDKFSSEIAAKEVTTYSIVKDIMLDPKASQYASDYVDSLRSNKQTSLEDFRQEIRDAIQSSFLFADISPYVKEANDLIESRYEITEEMRELGEFINLSSIPREKGDIFGTSSETLTKSNIKKVFDSFKDVSEKYYPTSESFKEHTRHLSSVLELITDNINKIGNITLTTEQIEGITQGALQYTLSGNDKSLIVSSSINPPASANGMSQQEVYLHELVHSATARSIDSSASVRDRIRELQKVVKKAVDSKGGYKIFLDTLPQGQIPSEADIEMAKDQYAYVFQAKNANTGLHEFITYAVTNPALIKFMKNTTVPVFKYESIKGENLLDTLLNILNLINHLVHQAIRLDLSNNSYGQGMQIIQDILNTQNAHQNKIEALRKKLFKGHQKFDDKVSDNVSKTVSKIKDKVLKSTARNSRGLIRKIAEDVNAIAKITGAKSAASLITDKIALNMNREIVNTFKEMTTGVLTPSLYNLLLTTNNRISKARSEIEKLSIDEFSSWWKSDESENMSHETLTSMTSVLFRTDLSSLLGVVSDNHRDIMDLLDNPSKVAQEQKKLLKRMKLPKEARKYADELGQFIVSHQTTQRMGHMNSYTIIQEFMPNATEDTRAQLDAYVSLVALGRLQAHNSRQVSLVSSFVAPEFNKDPQENGFTETLNYHNMFKKDVLQNQFRGNGTQTSKGWIIEKSDPYTDMEIGFSKDKDAMAKKGYTIAIPLQGVTNSSTAPDTMYVARNLPETKWISGILSTTANKHSGTTLSEILAQDPKYTDSSGRIDYTAINAEVRNRVAREKSGKVTTNTGGIILRPIRDENNNVVDLRVIMTNKTKHELFDPDLEIQNVFAHMRSSSHDKAVTPFHDKKIIDYLIAEQSDMMPSRPDAFINLLDPKGPYSEQYSRIPKEIRDYIKNFSVNGTFMVRDEIVEKVFGAPSKDVRNISVLQKEGKETQQYVAGVIQELVKEIVSFGVRWIVVLTPSVIAANLFSNIMTLKMHKIDFVYAAKKVKEGYYENRRYQEDLVKYRKLENKLKADNAPDDDSRRLDLQNIRSSIEQNKMHKMTSAGLHSIIAEDYNAASKSSASNKIYSTLKKAGLSKYVDKSPKLVKSLASNLWMMNSSAPFLALQELVQLSDFLARYAMIEHAVEIKGETFEKAKYEAVEAFVLFDENLTPTLQSINDLGFGVFLKYYFRNHRSVARMIGKNPSTVMSSAAIQKFTGIDTLGNANSSVFAGNFAPQSLVVDDYLEKIFTEIPLVSALTP